MTRKRLVGEVGLWVVSLFLALVCLRSGLMKMPGVPGEEFWERDFRRWGYPGWFRISVGIAELVSCALLLVPRFAPAGAGLFAAVMVGAIFTHATHNELGRLPFNVLLLVLSLVVVVARSPVSRRWPWPLGAPSHERRS
jgi:putative oxidoreductase